MKRFILFVLLVLFYSYSLASVSNPKALIADILATEVPSQENESKLIALFEHQDLGVRTTAKIRATELYWKTGKLELAENILNEMMSSFSDYTPKYQIETLLTWASFELRRNNFIEVEEYAKQASKIAEKSHKPLLGLTYSVLGSSYNLQRKFLLAKQYFERALEQYQLTKHQKGIFDALNSLGVMYKANGDLVNGTKYLLLARDAVESIGNKSDRAAVYYNLGDVFLESNEPDKAAVYYQEALEIDLALGDLGNIAYDYTGLANTFLALEKFSLALQNNQKAIQQLLQITAPQELSRAYLQQSNIYNKLNDENSRLSSLELAEKSAIQSQSFYQIMSVNIAKSKLHLDQKNFVQARNDLLEAHQVANNLSLDKSLLEINKLLSLAYQGLKNYEQANVHLNNSFKLLETLNSDDRREKSERYKRDLNLLEEQIKVRDLEQKEAALSQSLNDQKEQKQRLVIIMIVSVSVFLALAILLIQRRKLAILKANLFEQTLQQKQQLFADVSHELRTPLTALKLQIQALQYDLIANVEESYEKLAGKVNEINRLISDIYQLAQADTKSIDLNPKSIDLEKLFNGYKKDWQTTIEAKGFSWQCQLSLTNSRMSLDADRIKQVIDNLLSNSTIYTDKPGKISVCAFMQNKQLIVNVEDSAPTVSEDELDKIFSRLYRVESSRNRQTGGSGLGLAICESLVKAHGGTIKAEQSPLGGLKVTFKLS